MNVLTVGCCEDCAIRRNDMRQRIITLKEGDK